MNAPYEIRYLKTAECDLYGIFDYISQDNPSAAANLLEKIDNSISLLSSNPYLGVIPKDTRLRDKGYRMLIVEKYLVFYIVKDKTVQVRRIIHSARRYDFL
ncbi:MAG: type II toxin-antitoxin system RelE/ParE family toxin [bacterium]|nr:type II toxin-antitoxin system RelE/ParE family toxin [bacterium]